MSQLIDELRILIEDPGTDFTDAQLYKYLNKYRGYLDDVALGAENDSYLVWWCKYKYLDNRILDSALDTPILEAAYTADDINGMYTFAVAVDAVYIKANFFDLYMTASDMWMVRASQATFSGNVKLGDETIPQDKYNKEYCIQKYWMLRPSSFSQSTRTGANS